MLFIPAVNGDIGAPSEADSAGTGGAVRFGYGNCSSRADAHELAVAMGGNHRRARANTLRGLPRLPAALDGSGTWDYLRHCFNISISVAIEGGNSDGGFGASN